MSWLVAVGLLLTVAWACLSFLPAGADGHMPLPYLIALVDFLWIPSGIAAVLAAVNALWWLFAASCVVLAWMLYCDMPYWRNLFHRAAATADTDAETGSTADSGSTADAASAQSINPSVQVMTLNCRYGHADAQAICRAVRERAICVLTLQELSTELIDRLHTAGLDQLLPSRQLGTASTTDNGGFNGVWTSLPTDYHIEKTVDIPAADVPGLAVRIPRSPRHASLGIARNGSNGSNGHDEALSDEARTLLFASAHTKSPMRGCAQWSQGVIGLGAVAETAGHAGATVVMGDLNANLHHPSFRALLRSGYRDANLVQGRGTIRTFPSWLPWPHLELDHILFTAGVDASDVQSFRIAGTDHLALTAALSVG